MTIDHDLGHHGDSEVGEGLIDLAVNFPGLGPEWFGIAVRDTATTDAFVTTLTGVIEEIQ